MAIIRLRTHQVWGRLSRMLLWLATGWKISGVDPRFGSGCLCMTGPVLDYAIFCFRSEFKLCAPYEAINRWVITKFDFNIASTVLYSNVYHIVATKLMVCGDP